MKRTLFILLAITLCLPVFAGCAEVECEHTWESYDLNTAVDKCSKCEETRMYTDTDSIETENTGDGSTEGSDIQTEQAVIPSLAEIKDYTQEETEEKLIGISQEELHSAWGMRDGTLSGFWGDTWYLDSAGNEEIIVYYDNDGKVMKINK